MNNKKKNTGSMRHLLWWLVIAGVFIIGLFYYSNLGNTREEWSYEQFANRLTGENAVTDEYTYTKFDSITVNPKTNRIDISGVVIRIKTGDSREVKVTFVVRALYTDAKLEDIDEITSVAIASGRLENLHVVDPADDSNGWWTSIFTIVIIIAIFIIVMVLLMRKFTTSNNKTLEFGKSKARLEKDIKIKFNDVAGCEDEKAELVEVVDYLKFPEKYSKSGARIPKGVILKGPPGTGKTLLAKAVAGEANVPFFSISGSDFLEMFVGVGASRVRDMFKKARSSAPCILFIDEIDAVGRQRGAGVGGGHDEREQTLNQLLVEMDGFSPNDSVIVIAATNRLDILDPALLRPGRFDRQISVNLPDKAGRVAILNVHARNKKFETDVTLEHIASRTPGFSGAELENMLNEAAILSVRSNRNIISMSDLDEAVDRVMAGPAKTTKVMSSHERKLVAYHESGHAIVGLNLKHANVVRKITIIPRGEAAGYVLMTPDEDRTIQTKTELLAKVTSYLAGRVSEEIFFADMTTGAHDDISKATAIARAMVVELGMSKLGPIQFEKDATNVFVGRDYSSSGKNYSPEIARAIDGEVKQIVDECYATAKQIILDNKDKLILIAESLLEVETLNSENIENLMKYGNIDAPTKVDGVN